MSRDAESDPKTSRLYDKRTVERNIKKGLITRKDYDKHMKSLEDAAVKGVYGGLESRDDDDADDEPETADDAQE
ncbi:MAG TPA: hypothetical protein VHG72_09790 [Polyangia bacterium]|nr:hypothetical protein [Polyangia bacterium]